MRDATAASAFLAATAPFDRLDDAERDALAAALEPRRAPAGEPVHGCGDPVEGLYLIREGAVRLEDARGETLSALGPGDCFGVRELTRGGRAACAARAVEESALLMPPAARFRALVEREPAFRDLFACGRAAERARPLPSLAETEARALMTASPLTCGPGASIAEAARMMRARRVSSILVLKEGALVGILTVRDIAGRVVAEGRDPSGPVAEAMTADPLSLGPEAIGSDVLNLMMERGIGHVPVVAAEGLVGIVTRTDLTRFQADSSALLVREAARAEGPVALAAITARIPRLLAQIVAAGSPHQVVTRLVTDIADAATRRLLAMAEAELGPPPVPCLWLACGSQGRREQAGVSDQDNCLMIDDAMKPEDDAYFAALARIVSDGLNACGYVCCPGEMMATTPRWRRPLSVWRRYFRGWIATPDPMAQMHASVMFDLRPIDGEAAFFEGLRAETLAAARRNSIFVAHMVSNAQTHQPPLGLFRGLATLRSGARKDRIDMKLNGVAPVVDLGRIYALRGELPEVGTRARLAAARAAGVISGAGGRDLLDAYDLIAGARLEHQATQARAGAAPDNFLDPRELSEFERNHLRDAFVVVRLMQSAAAQGGSAL